MNLTVRRSEADEATLIADLNAVVQQLHHDNHPDLFKAPDALAFRPIVDSWLASPLTALFVAHEPDGDLIGYSVGVRNDRPDTPLIHGAAVVELDQVVVAPNARQRGVGQALCVAVIDWAEAEGVDRVELSTWVFNDVAYKAFESLGFNPTVRRMSRTTDRR